MGKTLVIVESEQKARAIRSQAGDKLQPVVIPSPPARAHYLPPPDPRRKDPLHFTFKPLPVVTDFLAIVEAAPAGTEILLAFDADRRGEYWSWLLNGCLLQASGGRRSAQRLRVSALDGTGITAALRHLDLLDEKSAKSYAVREIFSACFTGHCRRLLGTTVGPRNLPLTMGNLTPLILLHERENELRSATLAPRRRVRVRVGSPAGEFELSLQEVFGLTDEGVFRDEEQVRRAVEMLRNQPLRVVKSKRTPRELAAPAPFRLAELLAVAHLSHGFAPRQTFLALQSLYGGCRVSGKEQGLVSGWGTMADREERRSLLQASRRRAAGLWGAAALGPERSELDGDALLLPLQMELTSEMVAGELGGERAAIYRLIYRRALAAQLGPAQVREIELQVTAGPSCILQATGLQVVSPGFLAAEPRGEEEGGEEAKPLPLTPLAEVAEGEELSLQRIVPEESFAGGVEHFTIPLLADQLLEFSFEADALLPITLDALLGGDYISLAADGTLHCRENSDRLQSVLNRALPTMSGLNLVAYFEQTVDEVLSGRKSMRSALQQFDQTLLMQGNVLVKTRLPSAAPRRSSASGSVIKSSPPVPSPPAEPGVAPAVAEALVPMGKEMEEAPVEENPLPPAENQAPLREAPAQSAAPPPEPEQPLVLEPDPEQATKMEPELEPEPEPEPEPESERGPEPERGPAFGPELQSEPEPAEPEPAEPEPAEPEPAEPEPAEPKPAEPETAGGADSTVEEESAPARKKVLVRRVKGGGATGVKRKMVRVVRRKK